MAKKRKRPPGKSSEGGWDLKAPSSGRMMRAATGRYMTNRGGMIRDSDTHGPVTGTGMRVTRNMGVSLGNSPARDLIERAHGEAPEQAARGLFVWLEWLRLMTASGSLTPETRRVVDTITFTATSTSTATEHFRHAAEADLRAISHSALRAQQGKVFEVIAEIGALVVANRDRIDGILLSPNAFSELAERAYAGDRLRELLPLLLQAARDRVPVPSEALEALGVTAAEGEFDWRALNELLAAFPVEITHGEDGERLPDPAARSLRHQPVEELDEELIVR